MMLTQQMKTHTLEQAVKQIEISLHDMEGLMNLLQQEEATRPYSLRLKIAHDSIAQALGTIFYVTEQDSMPATPEELELGQRVQNAMIEISQI